MPHTAKQWNTSPAIIKLTPAPTGEADPKPITFTIQPLASDSHLKVNLKISEWWSNGTEHVTEIETKDQHEMTDLYKYYIERLLPEKVTIDHRGIKQILSKKQTLLWIQHQRKLTATILEAASSEDVDCCDLDTDTIVTDYDWHEKLVYRLQQLCANSLHSQSNWLHWESVLVGKDCPVLLEPLEPNKAYRLKCNHYISQEAWMKLKSPMQCPLCRADATSPYMCGINR